MVVVIVVGAARRTGDGINGLSRRADTPVPTLAVGVVVLTGAITVPFFVALVATSLLGTGLDTLARTPTSDPGPLLPPTTLVDARTTALRDASPSKVVAVTSLADAARCVVAGRGTGEAVVVVGDEGSMMRRVRARSAGAGPGGVDSLAVTLRDSIVRGAGGDDRRLGW